MAQTTILIVAADNGGNAAVVDVIVTVVSTAAGLFDGAGASLQRVLTTATAADGTLTLPVERTADITLDGSTPAVTTTTIQVGDEVYAGLTIPSSGTPVTLHSLIASSTDYTVAITLHVDDPSQAALAELDGQAVLSVDSTNLGGTLILAQNPVDAVSDSTGLLTWHLDRTDQLTPVDGSPEPFYTFLIGDSVYYKYVRGAGALASLPNAIPTSTSGGFGATSANISADASVATGSYAVPPLSLQDQLRQVTQLQARHVTASTYTVVYDDDVIDADATANSVAITLPTAVGWTKLIAIKVINLTHAVTITTTSAQTIDGVAPPLSPAAQTCYVLYSDGANWHVYATYQLGGGSTSAQSAHYAQLGPVSGAAATPTFREILLSDLALSVGSANGNATPETVGSTSLLDLLRGGYHSNDLWDLASFGIREFELQWYSGTYYLFHYESDNNTYVRSASTVAGLSSAADTVIIGAGHGNFPSALFDGTTWHVWTTDPVNNWIQHATAASVTGPYTVADTFGSGFSDPQVRRSPIDGKYYCTYKQSGSPFQAGCLVASSPGGTWTDLGFIWASIGKAAWFAYEQADPTPIFWNGRAYVAFSAAESSSPPQRIGLVEVNPTTFQAFAPAVCLVEPLETWQTAGSNAKVFNAIWLALPGEPGQEKLYYAHQPPGYVTGGWGYVQVGPPPPDGRRVLDGMRLDTSVGLDVATGIQPVAQGGITWGLGGLICNATPSGAYGWLGLNSLADFTLAVRFSVASLPGSDALLLRASPSAMGTNQAALWVTSSGLLRAKVIGSTTLTLTGVTTLTTNTVYQAVLRRIGSEVRLYLGTGEEASGTQGDALTGLTEWSVANDKGHTQAAGEQLLCTVFAAAVCGEALPLSADPFQGLTLGAGGSGSGTVTSVNVSVPADESVTGGPITSGGTLAITRNSQAQGTFLGGPTAGTPATPAYRKLVPLDLPIASTSQIGGAKADGTTITVAADGTFTAAASGSTLAGLGDTNISGPHDGDLLMYKASDGKWHNVDPTAPGGGAIYWAPLTDSGGGLIVDANGSAIMMPAAV